MFTEAFPILTADDLPVTAEFYVGLLGAVQTYEFRGEGGRLGYIGLQLGTSHLGIGQNTEPPGAGHRGGVQRSTLCVYTEDCDAAVAHLRGHGVPVVAEPVDQVWGERMAVVADPDGSEVIIMARGTTG